MSFITSPGVIVPPLTAGGVAYGTGSQAKMTSAGTAGQVLTSAGAGVPVFAAAAGGSWVTLGSGVVSGNPTTIDFETGFTDTTYSAIVIMLVGLQALGASGNPSWRFKQGGSYTATAYEDQTIEASGSGISTYRSTAQAQMVLAASSILNTADFSDMLIVKNRFSTAAAAGPSICTFGSQQSVTSKIGICQGVRQVGGAVQGARLFLTGGGGATQFASGSYVWYGMKAS